MTNEGDKSQRVDATGIWEKNAENFGVTTGEMLRRGGSPVTIRARNRSHREMRDAGMTFDAIGDATGGRDHATVMHNVQRDIAAGSEVVEISKAELDLEIEQYLQENFPGVSLADICGESRIKRIVVPRQALARHLFYDTRLYIKQICDLLHRGHSTIIYAVNKSEDKMEAQIQAWKKEAKKQIEKAEKAQTVLKAKQQLEEEKRRKSEMPAIIFTVVASTYQLGEDKIISSSKLKEVAWARHLIAYFLRLYTDLPLLKIAELLNRGNHATIINSIMRVEEKMELDEYIKEEVELVKENILDLATASNQATDSSRYESVVTEIPPFV